MSLREKIRNAPPQVWVAAALSVVSGVAAWRDIAARTDDDIRGSRTLWRIIIIANPGNSVFYWALGRRR